MREPITLTDGTTLRPHGAYERATGCSHGGADGCLIQEFRIHGGELQRRGVWDTAWEPAARRWAAQPTELRQAILELLVVTR